MQRAVVARETGTVFSGFGAKRGVIHPGCAFVFWGMKLIKGHRALLDEGQRLEAAGQPEAAAAAYQQVVDADPTNQDAVERLLVLYRRAKEYRKEMGVIDAALEAIARKDRSAQQKWIDAHPEAARLGKQVLRQLGGEKATGYGTDPMVERLMKRKAFVGSRIVGKKTAKKVGKTVEKKAEKKAGKGAGNTVEKKAGKGAGKEAGRGKKVGAHVADRRKGGEAEKKMAAKEAAAKKRRQAAERREPAAEKKAAAAEEKKAAAEKRRQAAEEKKRVAAEKERKAAEAQEAETHPPLFVVSLRYLVSAERIEAVLEKHNAFLNKHIAGGDFLLAGRQEPRTGVIIIARGKDREAIERIMRQDPLVMQKLASVDMVEFMPGKTAKGLRL